MKLRLRSLETQETQRVEVPSSCSLQQLKEILSQMIPLSSSSSSASSVHFSLNRKDELHGSSPEDSLQSLGVTSGDLIFFTFNPDGVSSGTLTVRSQVTQEPRSQQLQDSPMTTTLDHNSQTQEASDSESMISETAGSDAQKKTTQDLNTQIEESPEFMEVDDGPVADMGKAFSVPGFLRKVFTEALGDDGGRHHKLLVIAVHAVLLESGFVAFDPVSKMAVNGFHYPVEWPSSIFRMSMWYTLPEITDHRGDDVNGIDTVILKFQSLGKHFSTYGSLAEDGYGTHRVCVNEHELVPFLNVVWANCDSGGGRNGKYGALSTSPEREVFKFWKTVKDKLALPLLIDLCEKAGLAPPLCFMRLPSDLKLKILELLPGIDIAKVGCVSSELRYLASSDDLWRQKFLEQFGDGEGSQDASHWKQKFAKAWEKRKRRKRASTRFFPRSVMVQNPIWGPRIIGGNHDIWPHLADPFPIEQPGRAFHRLLNSVPRCNLGGP